MYTYIYVCMYVCVCVCVCVCVVCVYANPKVVSEDKVLKSYLVHGVSLRISSNIIENFKKKTTGVERSERAVPVHRALQTADNRA
jgi:hypothetical protein